MVDLEFQRGRNPAYEPDVIVRRLLVIACLLVLENVGLELSHLEWTLLSPEPDAAFEDGIHSLSVDDRLEFVLLGLFLVESTFHTIGWRRDRNPASIPFLLCDGVVYQGYGARSTVGIGTFERALHDDRTA